MYFSTLAVLVELWHKNRKIPVDTGTVSDGVAAEGQRSGWWSGRRCLLSCYCRRDAHDVGACLGHPKKRAE